MTKSIFNKFLDLYQSSAKAQCFFWKDEWHSRERFLSLISIITNLLKEKLRSSDYVIYYGANHPVALALPFACEYLNLKYIPIPETVSMDAALEFKKIYQINLGFFLNDTIENFMDAEKIWAQNKNTEYASIDLNLKPNANHEKFGIGFLTSGSTGSPKLIFQNNQHILANIAAAVNGQLLTEGEKVLAAISICHSGGLCIQTLPAIFTGCPLVLMQKFSVKSFFSAIDGHDVKVTLLVPSYLRLIRLSSFWDREYFKNLRLAGIGSSQLDVRLAQDSLKIGIPLFNIYGLTEAGPFALYGAISNTENGIVSIGKPAINIEIKLLDGASGKIYLRGSAVQPLLLEGTQEKRLLDAEGWYNTNDFAVKIGDEYFFTGRQTDIANVGGLKVNLIDLEQKLSAILNVNNVVVFLRPHSLFGEILVACIESIDTKLTARKILKMCKGQLPRHMIPRNILIIPEFPKSSIGKVLKNKLKEKYYKKIDLKNVFLNP